MPPTKPESPGASRRFSPVRPPSVASGSDVFSAFSDGTSLRSGAPGGGLAPSLRGSPNFTAANPGLGDGQAYLPYSAPLASVGSGLHGSPHVRASSVPPVGTGTVPEAVHSQHVRPELSPAGLVLGSLGSGSPGGSTASCGTASHRELSPQTSLAGFVSMGTQAHQLLPQLPQQLAQAQAVHPPAHPLGASSSVAATEGSPPSSPRSTFSSVHSFGQHEVVSVSLPAGPVCAGSPSGPCRSGVLGLGPAPNSNCCLGGNATGDASRSFCQAHNVLDSPGTCPRRSPGKPPAAGQELSELNGEERPAEFGADLSSGTFEVLVQAPSMKFNCGHFIAYRGFRERLHGHNYSVTVKIGGIVGPDGYILDFGDIKQTAREVCKSLDEHLIVPMKSDVLDITQEGQSIIIRCEDGAEFKVPCSDCKCLPIVHSSAEEITCYLWQCIVDKVTVPLLKKRGATWVEVAVWETPSQMASFRREV
ncbi:6-pyruvoyl tetrahydrobiopterin synthase [Toxoplasma gondii RUB]|uniref:6-pyruvoyltetrahydropterin synthase n=1 Tax=Toxoplasma gondii RUB TaxID=935652 RepID=A0A086LRN4_TOXGO|nr:6-pyruvoyl tetrahydrobiopterin synthase [Toxoplasma gondii RUB]